MKKLFYILGLILISIRCLQAMESKDIIVKGKICVMPIRSVYVGQGKVDPSGKKDIRTLLNDKSIKPNDILQEVWAWDGNQTSTRFSSNPNRILSNSEKEVFFPTHLPYKYLQNLKEGETLKISIEGIRYELTADQKNGRYPNDGNTFQEVLKNQKALFNRKPNFFNNDKKYLLKKRILWDSWWGTTTHHSTKYKFYSLFAFSLLGGIEYFNPGSAVNAFKSVISNLWSRFAS